MSHPVNVPGFAVDGSTSELLLDGQPLPVAMEDIKWGAKVTRDMIYLLGQDKPAERTGGYREYTFSATMPMRQLCLLAEQVGSTAVADANGEIDLLGELTSHEFAATINLRPKGNSRFYAFKLARLTFDDLEFSLDPKSASKVPITGTFMDLKLVVK